jgi:hypothetical protein
MQEMVSCCVAVSNKPNPLRPAFSNKQSACEPKPNCFHLAQLGTISSAEPGGPKQPPISTNGLRRRDFGRLNNRSFVAVHLLYPVLEGGRVTQLPIGPWSVEGLSVTQRSPGVSQN